MRKVDAKKTEAELYRAPRDHAVVVDVPDEPFIMLDGEGSPSDPAFQKAIGALYAVAYGVKFRLRKEHPGVDHVVNPLEALWWWDEGPTLPKDEKRWRWRLMIREPDGTTAKLVLRAMADGKPKHPDLPIERVRFERYCEGRSMQILHVGPYKDEAATVERLHSEMTKAGLAPAGRHHEIYLGDPRRSKPENLKTLLRQPVSTVAT